MKSKQPLQFKKLLLQTLSTTPKATPNILNLPPYNFSNIQLYVLGHSTKCTWNRSGSLFNYKNDLSNFTKNIQLKDIFNDTKYEDDNKIINAQETLEQKVGHYH